MNKDLDIQILEDARTIVHHDDCLPAEAPLKHKKHHDHQAVDLDWLLESRSFVEERGGKTRRRMRLYHLKQWRIFKAQDVKRKRKASLVPTTGAGGI